MPAQQTYSDVIAKTEQMVSNRSAQKLAAKHRLGIVNVTWEDAGRYKGSAVGPNISDMTIQVQDQLPDSDQYKLTCMPVIRYPNFTDVTGDISPDLFFVLVGNEEGEELRKITLRELLRNLRTYLHDPWSWKGDRKSLFAEKRDSHVLVSAQACFLPIPQEDIAEFNPVLFNYQSSQGNPAVLAILATREGTSVTVIDNTRDGFEAGRTWGQRLFFILVAMDRELARFDPQSFYQDAELTSIAIEDTYLNAIIRIGDRRIASELIKRYRVTSDPQMRRRWACTAYALGSSEVLKEYAYDLEHGKITLPQSGKTADFWARYPGDREHATDVVALRAIVRDLSVVPTPEVTRALEAMTDPKHPFYQLLSERLLVSVYWHVGNEAWIAHPYCLKLLRRELDNTDVDRRDGAAKKLQELVFGMPAPRALQGQMVVDPKAARSTFDSYHCAFRQVTAAECKALSAFYWQVGYIPDIRPLGRVATDEDVKAGRAIFHLPDQAKLARLELPAAATLRGRTIPSNDGKSEHRVLVVQAEIDSKGAAVYGIIGDGPGHMVKAGDLTDIQPIEKAP